MKVVLAAGAWTSDVLYRSSIKLPHSSEGSSSSSSLSIQDSNIRRHAEFFVGKPIVSDIGICTQRPLSFREEPLADLLTR